MVPFSSKTTEVPALTAFGQRVDVAATRTGLITYFVILCNELVE